MFNRQALLIESDFVQSNATFVVNEAIPAYDNFLSTAIVYIRCSCCAFDNYTSNRRGVVNQYVYPTNVSQLCIVDCHDGEDVLSVVLADMRVVLYQSV